MHEFVTFLGGAAPPFDGPRTPPRRCRVTMTDPNCPWLGVVFPTLHGRRRNFMFDNPRLVRRFP